MSGLAQESQVEVDDNYDEDEYMLQRLNWLHAAKKLGWSIDYTNAREIGNAVWIKELEVKNPDLPYLYEELGPCDETEYFAYCRLVLDRYRCLKANDTYKRYCDAKRAGDLKAIEEIEGAHGMVREIYSDWDDLYTHGLSDEDWVDLHHSLFFPAKIQVVMAGEAAPLGVQTTEQKLDEYHRHALDRLYWATRQFAEAVGKRPKYQIERVGGRESYAKTHQRLNLAWFVHDQLVNMERPQEEVANEYFFDLVVYEGMGVEAQDLKAPANEMGNEDDIIVKMRSVRRLAALSPRCIDLSIEGIYPARLG